MATPTLIVNCWATLATLVARLIISAVTSEYPSVLTPVNWVERLAPVSSYPAISQPGVVAVNPAMPIMVRPTSTELTISTVR